jgi:hypothetical protein
LKIQHVSKYLALAEEGLVEKIVCPIDQGLLSVNLDYEDNIYLYCLSCKYKNNIGLSLYNKIKMKVDNARK